MRTHNTLHPEATKASPQKKHNRLSAAEEALLHGIYTYDFLTVKQAKRLYYNRQSSGYVGELLRNTITKGYAYEDFLPRKVKFGRSPSVFFLSKQGVEHFLKLGYPPPRKYYTQSEVYGLSYLFWKHTLAVTDFIISARMLEKVAPGYLLNQFQHDRELQASPTYVQGDSGKKRVGVIPDAWLQFFIPGASNNTPQQIAMCLELDRGTISVKPMKEKLRACLKFIDGPYQEAFHTNAVTIAYATPSGHHRAELLRSWCEQVLTEQKRKDDSKFFYFTALPQQMIDFAMDLDPHTLFLSPVWYTPFSTDPKVLLAP